MLLPDNLPPARKRTRPIASGGIAAPTSVAAASPAAVPVMTAPAASPTAAEPPPPGSYEVGYRKPPLHTRFQRGQSGNPKGRKKGSENLDTMVLAICDERIAVNSPAGPKRIPRIEVLLRKQLELALKGNPRAIDQVLRQYGQAQGIQTARADAASGTGDAQPDLTEADTLSLQLLHEQLTAEIMAGLATGNGGMA